MFDIHVAVASQRDLVAVDSHDAVEDIFVWRDFSKHGVAYRRFRTTAQQGFVALMAEEGAHTVAFQGQSDGLSHIDVSYHLGEEILVRYADVCCLGTFAALYGFKSEKMFQLALQGLSLHTVVC